MNKFSVRIPIAGYVEIEVEADNKTQATHKAFNQFSLELNPRAEVTDLNAFEGIKDMHLATAYKNDDYDLEVVEEIRSS
jgi:hypothetical protein